jgi:SAM-dependent methyltransferase
MANDMMNIDDIARYYTEKLWLHGATAQGVDWNSFESQVKRFDQLCKIIDTKNMGFSINDLGCGYGALLKYLQDNYQSFTYLGVDISHEMIKSAEQRHARKVHQARFITSREPDQIADYGIASGIFNVRLKRTDAEWLDYLKLTLDLLDSTSRRGFAFNCLTSYSDEDKQRDDLYYADPCQLFDLCKKRYSRDIALLHDYGIYEFTILVRKRQ